MSTEKTETTQISGNSLRLRELLVASGIDVGHTRRVTDGEQLQRRRKALRLTQEDLASRAGVNKETIVRIEADDDSVKVRTLRKVKAAMDQAERDLLRQGIGASSVLIKEPPPYADEPVTLSAELYAELERLTERLFRIVARIEGERRAPSARRPDPPAPENGPPRPPRHRGGPKGRK